MLAFHLLERIKLITFFTPRGATKTLPPFQLFTILHLVMYKELPQCQAFTVLHLGAGKETYRSLSFLLFYTLGGKKLVTPISTIHTYYTSECKTCYLNFTFSKDFQFFHIEGVKNKVTYQFHSIINTNYACERATTAISYILIK